MKNKVLFFGYGGLRDPRMMSAILGEDKSGLSGRSAILENYRLILQRLDQVPDTIIPGAPIQVSAQDLLRKSWDENFLSYAIQPSEGERVTGTIWEITQADLERLRDWELMDFGWYEDCTGIAETTSGEKVSVVSVKLGKNQSIDREVNGMNYETWSQDPKRFIEVAHKARLLYDEQMQNSTSSTADPK